MPFSTIAYPEQLAVLTDALRRHCSETKIEPGSPAYYDAGRLAIILFESGITTPEGLANALRKSTPGDLRQKLKTPKGGG